MRKISLFYFILIASVAFPFVSNAQVKLDPSGESFNGGNSLPAKSSFFVSGEVKPNTSRVVMEFYRHDALKGSKLSAGSWKRPLRKEVTKFSIEVPIKLVDGNHYDILIYYFGPLSPEKKVEVRSTLDNGLSSYLQAGATHSMGKNIDAPHKSSNKWVSEMNNVFKTHLKSLTGEKAKDFKGYSNRIRDRVWKLNELIKAYRQQSRRPIAEDLKKMIDQHLADIRMMALEETDNYMEKDMEVLVQKYEILGYPAGSAIQLDEESDEQESKKKVKKDKVGKIVVGGGVIVAADKKKKVKEPKVKEPKVKEQKNKEPKVKQEKEPKVKEPKVKEEKKVKEVKEKEPKVKKDKKGKIVVGGGVIVAADQKKKKDKEPKVKEPTVKKEKDTKVKQEKEKEPKVKEPKQKKEKDAVVMEDPYWHHIALNLGYSAVLLSSIGDAIDGQASFGGAPYIGLSIPFAKRSIKILRPFSLSFGMFLSQPKNEEEEVYRGSDNMKFPMYVGVGIQTTKLIRLNIGATFLKRVPGGAESTEVTEGITRLTMGLALDLDWNLLKSLKLHHEDDYPQKKKKK